MSDHLAKAKAALDAAAQMEVDLASGSLPRPYLRLIDLAQIQAQVAQAEALDHLARAIEEHLA